MAQEPAGWTPELERAYQERFGEPSSNRPAGWNEYLERAYQEKFGPSTARWLGQAARSVPAGLAQAVGGVAQLQGNVLRLAYDTVLPEDMQEAGRAAVRQFDVSGAVGRKIQEVGRSIGTDPIVEDAADGVARFLAKDVAEAVGQSVPAFATGGLGAAAGLGTRGMTALAGATGAAQSGQSFLQEAQDANASTPEQWGALLVGAGLGTLNAAEPAMVFARLGKAAPGLMGALKTASREGLTEATTESLEQVGQDLYAKGTFDPDRDLQGWMRAGGAGGVAGAFISALVSGAQRARKPRKPGQQELPLEPEPAQGTTPPPEGTAPAPGKVDPAIVDRLVKRAIQLGIPAEEEADYSAEVWARLAQAENLEAEIQAIEQEMEESVEREEGEEPPPRPIEVVPPETKPAPPETAAAPPETVQPPAPPKAQPVETTPAPVAPPPPPPAPPKAAPAPKPAPKPKPVPTGERPAFSQRMLRGEGATREEVYGPENVAAGRAHPILGPGRYYAFDEEDAKRYGPRVATEDVKLSKPFVLDSDSKWQTLVEHADAQVLHSMYPDFYKSPGETEEATKRLQEHLRERGYDGVVVTVKEDDSTRRLREAFGHSQVVMFGEPAKAAAAEQPKAAPTPPSTTEAPPPVGEEGAAPKYQRKTPAPGTKERADLEAEITRGRDYVQALDEKRTLIREKQAELQKKLRRQRSESSQNETRNALQSLQRSLDEMETTRIETVQSLGKLTHAGHTRLMEDWATGEDPWKREHALVYLKAKTHEAAKADVGEQLRAIQPEVVVKGEHSAPKSDNLAGADSKVPHEVRIEGVPYEEALAQAANLILSDPGAISGHSKGAVEGARQLVQKHAENAWVYHKAKEWEERLTKQHGRGIANDVLRASNLASAKSIEMALASEARLPIYLREHLAAIKRRELDEAAREKFEIEIFANLVDPSKVTAKKSAFNGNIVQPDADWSSDGRVLLRKSAVKAKKVLEALNTPNPISRYGKEGLEVHHVERVVTGAVDKAKSIQEVVGVHDPRLRAKADPTFKARAQALGRSEDTPIAFIVLANGDTMIVNADYFALLMSTQPDELRGRAFDAPLVALRDGQPVGVLMPITVDARPSITDIREKQRQARESIALQNQVAQEENPAEPNADFGTDELGASLDPIMPEDRTPTQRLRRPADPTLGGPTLTPDAVADLAGYPSFGVPEGQEVIDEPGRLYGRIEAPPGRSKKTTIKAVMDSIAKVVHAAGSNSIQRAGRITKKEGARGYFLPLANLTRINNARNISTAAHEMGHALERAVYGWLPGGPWQKPLIGPKEQNELVELGKKLYGKTRPSGGYKREGFAEFMRLYVAQPEIVRKEAPKFHAWFEGTFLAQNRPIGEALDNARDQVTTWRMQGSAAREAAQRYDPSAPSEIANSWLAKLRRTFSMRAWVDIFMPLVEPEKAAAAGLVRWFDQLAKVDKNLAMDQAVRHMRLPAADVLRIVETARKTGRFPIEYSPFGIARAKRQLHTAMVDRWMHGSGVTDLTGNNVVGPSLQDVLAPIRGRGDLFMAYLRALRSEHLWKSGRDPGMSQIDARALRQALENENPDFPEAQERFIGWWNSVMDYAAQASPTFARSIKLFRQADPEGASVYVTLAREFEQMDADMGKAGWGGSVFQGRVSSRLKGSGRRVKEILPTMLARAEGIVLCAHRRMVLDALIKLSFLPDVGPFVVEVPARSAPVYDATVQELIDRLKLMLRQSTGADAEIQAVDETSGEPLPIEDLANEMVTFFMPEMPSDNGQPLVPVWDSTENKTRYFEVKRAIYDTLMGMELYRFPKWIDWFFSWPREAFKMGTTGWNASFGLVTNPLRDGFTFYFNTRSSANGARILFELFRMYGMAALHRTTGGRISDPHLKALLQMGGEMVQPLGQDTPHASATARSLTRERSILTLRPTDAYRFARELLQTFEMAPRAAEFKLVAQEIGWAPGQHMTLSQSLQLMTAAGTITTDFRAGGAYAQAMNRAIPFFNAAIQGPRSFVEAWKRNPRRVWLKGLELSMLTIALYWWTRDDEWREEMPEGEQYRYWHIPVDINGRKMLMRIPRPFEIGGLFAALPEAAFRAWRDQEPEAVEQWAKQFIENSTPNMWPPLLKQGAEQLANENFWTNTPIVPRGDIDKPSEEQAGDYTSRLATRLGDLFDVSPRRIDHFVKGTFGGLGHDALMALGGRATEAESEPSDIPVLGVLFGRGGELGNRPRSIDDLYSTIAAAVQRSKSRRNPETPEERQRRLLLEDAGKAVTAGLFVRRYTAQQSKRDEIMRSLVEIAREAQAQASNARIDRSGPYLERKRWEFEKRALEYAREQRGAGAR